MAKSAIFIYQIQSSVCTLWMGVACYLLQSMAGAHGCCPLWVAEHITMVETVHMTLEGKYIVHTV